MATRKQIEANRKNALKAGRPVASATLRAQMIREELTKAVYDQLEDLYTPQIEKAKKGDTMAFNSLMDKTANKVPNVNENHEIKDYRLEDPKLQAIHRRILELDGRGHDSGTGAES